MAEGKKVKHRDGNFEDKSPSKNKIRSPYDNPATGKKDLSPCRGVENPVK